VGPSFTRGGGTDAMLGIGAGAGATRGTAGGRLGSPGGLLGSGGPRLSSSSSAAISSGLSDVRVSSGGALELEPSGAAGGMVVLGASNEMVSRSNSETESTTESTTGRGSGARVGAVESGGGMTGVGTGVASGPRLA
jgi:hypothetical protein